jgi:hypothetical protein
MDRQACADPSPAAAASATPMRKTKAVKAFKP